MTSWITSSLQMVAAVGAAASMLYYLASIGAALRFHAERASVRPQSPFMPPVTFLKPLKGTDPGMYENLSSHCQLDYPEYEIIFGVNDPEDPALEIVRRVQSAFPHRKIHIVVCSQKLGANIKVSNLAQMLPYAQFQHLVVNDSDIRLEWDYLKNVIAPLAITSTGLVTCLYRGIASASTGSRLESLGISTDFAAGVLTARYLENGIRFGLGSTLAFRKNDLQEIGGFIGFVDYLADDYQIGRRIAGTGKKVELSTTVVETSVPHYSMQDFWNHQLRWARTVRDSRRLGYLGLIFTFGFFWALVALVAARGARWAWALFAATAVLRLMQAATAGRICLQDRQAVRFLWLLPLRDLVAVSVWFASLFGHTIHWRGDVFQLKNGKLTRFSES